MKDKASVIEEVTKLQEIRDELTTEVQRLHTQLEQERSKTRASTTDVKTAKQNVKNWNYVLNMIFIFIHVCRTRRDQPVRTPKLLRAVATSFQKKHDRMMFFLHERVQ